MVLFFRLNSDEILLVFDDRVDSKIYVFRDDKCLSLHASTNLFEKGQSYLSKSCALDSIKKNELKNELKNKLKTGS